MQSIEGKNIVVTGGAGFIGSNLALFFEEMGANVLVIDIFRSGDRFENGNLKSFGHYKNLLDFNGFILEGDINDKKVLKNIKKFKPYAIFHEAAISDTTASNQSLMIKTNLNSFINLLEISKDINSKMIYASSGATYGNAKSPQKVWECEEPRNVYGFSKLMMDRVAKKYYDSVHCIGLRYFNVYGKNEFFKEKTASMVLQFGLQILSGNSPKLFEGSKEIKRDFVYIKDVINANYLALFSKKSGVYNAATGKARSFQDIADILQKELNTDYKNIYIKNPFANQYQYFTQADISQTQKDLGYEPKFSLEEGIRDYLPEIKRVYESEFNA
ncbi:ADP-glyceromanno-heptose 6-epimerase [Campylobacter sp. FMV-PI01]|uniref:ADP-glyceromanno-heptose 6-epimerase n=1 Tax=Campylobacter portucalensis TaxID=2608384 RepID=A0A6L5WGZ5_9BACT|nr:ADP-glyceromanno-heptose 6-epimerase [Campylobacter portucalensis]MSN96116.1 ADP-glyceromanno-heptose 6-epimerase [Campylobacter portucalensis]